MQIVLQFQTKFFLKKTAKLIFILNFQKNIGEVIVTTDCQIVNSEAVWQRSQTKQ